MQLTDFVKKLKDFPGIIQTVQDKKKQLVTGLSGSARTILISAIHSEIKHPLLLVTDTLEHMNSLANDLESVLPEDQVYTFPVEEMIAAEVATSSPNYRLARVQALDALSKDEPCVVVTATAGVRRRLPAPDVFAQAKLSVKVGGDVDPKKLNELLSSMGYIHQKMVLRPGDYAIRGSIIDVYALNTDAPVRIDLFDTEVDSLRYFDVSTQRSIKNVDAVTILPATDFLLPTKDFKRVHDDLAKELDQLKSSLGKNDNDILTQLDNRFTPLLDDLSKNRLPAGMLEFSNLVYPTGHSLLDYLPDDGALLIDDYTRLKETNKDLTTSESGWLTDKVKRNQRTNDDLLSADAFKLVTHDKHGQIYFALFQKGMGNLRLAKLSDISTRPMQRFFGQMELFKKTVQRWRDGARTVVLMAQTKERQRSIAQTMADFGVDVVESKDTDIKPNVVQLVDGSMANGFELPTIGLVVVTEGEMFKRVTKRRVRSQKLANAERLKSYTDLKPGDYVVHVNHGVGIFSGIKTMVVDGVHRDYMVINYRDNAQIFVPVDQLNLVQKYVSSESKKPRINKLGGNEWARTKRRVASKVEDIADELVDLYSKRESEKGFAFPKDDYLQEEFEQNFPYQDTPDQKRSTEEIKKDMESSKPMDRLLIGDVGYGKTEVALRAAFKAIQGGKQVAFLVPTTVLAQQHYDTIKERFAGFPVNAAIMSRFRTNKQLKETDKGLADGSIDIVVGTHRLLSKDVQFKDLGLLIIDEEQRFGVKHKERLKQMKANVDVLTLTATPIPRTLNMSMLGVRDLSVIETPPAGRFPIQTYVMEQNAAAIHDGIEHEMDRGGQVYYLHNRVGDIEHTVAQLQDLVPDARIGYIHGKMNENELETVLYDFIQGQYDVLVTTSIIETGVDIPNVNTLFVENADRMGLAQLYQIRGRIGRTNRVAYAYFMYQPNKVLTELGEKRLAAIRDFTELGSGFKIAMRDLAIRGAGNLLGKQQHGFIDSVGYDMYSAMLNQAVAKKRGKKKAPRYSGEIELGVEAYLPSSYITDSRQKIELYKQIRAADSEDALMDIQGDLIDRFGDYPQAVGRLLQVTKIKLHADNALIQSIHRDHDRINILFSKVGSTRVSGPDAIKEVVKTKFKSTMSDRDGQLGLRLVIQPKMTEDDWLNELAKLVVGLEKVSTKGMKNDETA